MVNVGPVYRPPRIHVVEEFDQVDDVDWLNRHLSLADATDIVYRNHLCIPPLPSGKGGCKCITDRTRRP